jgi:hypothetical protein
MWANNPVRKRRPDLPVGWVLEDNRGRIVGSLGSVPFAFELDGREVIAGTSSGWIVDGLYRGYALWLLDHFLCQEGVDVHLCVSPNSQAEPSVVAQCDRVPVGVWNRAALWITSYRGLAGSVLAKHGVPGRALLRYPVAAAFAAGGVLRRDGLGAAQTREHRKVRICREFDDRFDEFWDELRAAHHHLLLASRTREVLDWHYRYPLALGKAWVATVSEGDRLAAYAVFCRKDVAGIGLRRVRLIDYQSLDGTTSLLVPMLADALERCRGDGIAVLESIGWQLDKGDFMDRMAPYTRPMPSWNYYYKTDDPALAGRLRERAPWRPSQYDGDACL